LGIKEVRGGVPPGEEPRRSAEQDDGKPTTGKTLLEALVQSGFIGAWKDRTDIGDSVEFARQLRERAAARASE
jgi:hypothetical protein